MKFATKAIHVGEEPGLASNGDVVVPIHLSTTFARREVDKPRGGYEYSRTANPTRDALELRLAALEESKHALAFASGLAAEATLVLSLLKKGDHVVAFDDLYGGTRRLFSQTLSNFGLDFTYVDAREARNVDRAVSKRTKMIWLESPTNPLLKICDIKAISEVASRHQIITVVDNTFMSPYFQNPLQLGADVVLHSATKYLGGHSDVLGGAIMTSNEEIYTKAKFNQNAIGAVPSPFDCFLLLRGMKTLAIRMERHVANAARIAQPDCREPECVNAQNGKIGIRILAYQLRHALARIGRDHLDMFGPVDHVAIGNEKSIWCKDKTRPAATAPAC